MKLHLQAATKPPRSAISAHSIYFRLVTFIPRPHSIVFACVRSYHTYIAPSKSCGSPLMYLSLGSRVSNVSPLSQPLEPDPIATLKP